MTDRPAFSLEMPVSEFLRHYWYKDELAAICKSFGVSGHGTKAELQQRVTRLLSGEQAEDAREASTRLRKKAEAQQITLHTRLIPEGFKFNKQAREFFARYYGRDRFSFTKEMAAALREAERTGNHDMTVADLIRVYEGKSDLPAAKPPEEETYQWNRFVKDFNADPLTKGMKDRMKVAAALWRQVRDDPAMSKSYSPQCLKRYMEAADESK